MSQVPINKSIDKLTSSPRPIGNSKTFFFKASWKERVTGIEPPSRVKSGLMLYTVSTAFAAATKQKKRLHVDTKDLTF